MIRKEITCFFFIILLFPLNTVYAQTSNNWIDYTQRYYKIPVVENGVYRITHQILQQIGIPPVNPKNIQLFHKGKEVPIYISGEDDGGFDPGDYIEFIGRKNDGWLDSILYNGLQNQPNPHYSLFTDTASYFLTWNSGVNNTRYTLEMDTSFSTTPATNYYIQHNTVSFDNTYFLGKPNAVEGHFFDYIPTKGWGDGYLGLNQSKSKNIATKNTFTNATEEAHISLVYLGLSDFQPLNNGDHHITMTVGNHQILDTIFEGFKQLHISHNIPLSFLGSNTTQFITKCINDIGTTVDYSSLTYYQFSYPHTTDLENKDFVEGIRLPGSIVGSKTHYTFSNIGGQDTIICYDITSSKKIIGKQLSGNNYSCIIDSPQNKSLLILNEETVQEITLIEPVNTNGYFTNYTQNAIDSAFIIITHPLLETDAQNYANYKSSTGFHPMVVNIEELYDQYSYGIQKHPLSIYYFTQDALSNWSSKPEYLFLAGKSITNNIARQDPINFAMNLVPSYGSPSSDIKLTSGPGETSFVPQIPTGRISANTSFDITNYLQKIQDYEIAKQQPVSSDPWSKTALHFAGGTSQSEAQQLLSYLDNYGNTWKAPFAGGKDISFAKTVTAPTQTSLSDSILDHLKDGAALMTFFGHASASGGFDQNIDDPQNWPNQYGKYPFLIGNSCLAGDIHLPSSNSISEKYILTPNKGVIGFLASVDLGVANFLNQYTGNLYEQFSLNLYGESMGKCIQATCLAIRNSTTNELATSTCLGMTLHGDPSLKLPNYDLPDYAISAASIFTTPTQLTSDIDSFEVHIIIDNLGKAINTTLSVDVTRKYPNNTKSDTNLLVITDAPFFKDTISFKLPIDMLYAIGQNTLEISIDRLNVISELSDLNNNITYNFSIYSGEIIPVIPYNYAVIPTKNITLKASTAFPFSSGKNYLFQIDTTDLFNSPILETQTIYSSGGMLSWSPLITQQATDSMVFYWRVSPDSTSTNNFSWRESTFQFIPGVTGWGQDHFFQFKKNTYQFINYNRSNREFEFTPTVSQLNATTYGAAAWSELWDIKYGIDANKLGYGGWGLNSALHVAIIDSLKLTPWKSDEIDLGQGNFFPGAGGKSNIFIYRVADSTQMADLGTTLSSGLPNGTHVLIYTWYYSNFPQYAPLSGNFKQTLNQIGGQDIALLPDSFPFIFYTEIGNPSASQAIVGDSLSHKGLTIQQNISGNGNYGYILSENFGPSSSWDSLKWNMNTLDILKKDSSVLNVVGITSTGSQHTLITDIAEDSSGINISPIISASQYPFLQLQTYVTDQTYYTSPQLDRWHLTGSSVPEVAITPNIHYTLQHDTVFEGDTIYVELAVKNISSYPMDSLLINYKINNIQNQTHSNIQTRSKPLAADSIVILKYAFSTTGLTNLCKLIIDVNHNNDQVELTHFNNIAEIPFYVLTDDINPLLDVTFDGVHILDGEIISAKPLIEINLTDENPYRLSTDTGQFTIHLQYPNGENKAVYFNNPEVTFIPADNSNNKCNVIYNPTLKDDGIYSLRVNAKDASNNYAGDFDYSISFEVINQSSITHVLNFPNPFSNATQFIFTLTGSVVPDEFVIQIMTISGKVVKEITKEEIGLLRIGLNKTSYRWDGTDKFGDPLANGVYLYRVITSLDEELEHKTSSYDHFFKKGWGKLTIIR